MYIGTQNGCSLATFLIETESRNTKANSKKNMAVMASDVPSPYFPSLHLGLPATQSSRCHHAQSLLGPSFNASCPRILPQASRASLPPRRWATTCCRLSLRPCTAPLSCSLRPLLKLSSLSLGPSVCSNLSQSFHSCWITETQSLNLRVWLYLFFSSSAFAFLIEMIFSFESLFTIWS